MSEHRFTCPDSETLAAFVDGLLSNDELALATDHLLVCRECRQVVGDAARFHREVHLLPKKRESRRISPWWLSAAAAALVGVALLSPWRPPSKNESIARLVDATPRDSRDIEPRLSGGFPWAPLRPTMRSAQGGQLDADRMKLIGVAGTVIKRSANDDSIDARHASAIAYLLAGQTKTASTLLTEVTSRAGHARIWSDLAVVRYIEAEEMEDPSLLAEALAAADEALRLDVTCVEALFNRALVIERLGLRNQARAAWQRYITVDPKGPWATEAERHLRALEPRTEFRNELNRNYEGLQRNDLAAQTLAREYPQEARVWGESEILARWAESTQNGDAAAATAHLRVARAFAQEITPRGDSMLADAIAAIDAADAAHVRRLADGHLCFRLAQRRYKAGMPSDAEGLFARAHAEFEAGASPLALVAAYLSANTIYDQRRLTESAVILETLSTTAPAKYPAHRAQVAWQLGLVRASQGRWGDAIDSLTDSVRTFELLHETRYASRVRSILAEVYDRIGDSREAWQHRITALREIDGDSDELRISIDALARNAAANREWSVTVALLGLQLELLDGSDDEAQTADVLVRRARMNMRLGHDARASEDLARAGNAIDRIQDPMIRERVHADRLAVQGELATSPEAIALLTRALTFHKSKGRRSNVPELYLLRGRALVANGNKERAAADFEAGVREIESVQRLLSPIDRNGELGTTTRELYEEAVALALLRGDVTSAFSYAERAQTPVEFSKAMAAIPPGDIIIEYLALPRHLVIFTVKDGRIQAVQIEIARHVLLDEIDQLAMSATSSDRTQFRHVASALYKRLIAPVVDEITEGGRVIFVPDSLLGNVPFAALVGPDSRYMVEKYTIIVAPSATTFARRTARSHVSTGPIDLLLIAGPFRRDGNLGRLSSAQNEAEAVAAVYASRAKHANPTTRAGFEARAASADVIHFVGHAVASDDRINAALATSRADGTTDHLTVDEISVMRLTHTRTVVLAACNTGRNRKDARHGNMSVAQAFLAAGVPSVVATLWNIDDAAAAEFFPRFHEHLAQGRSPADALRATQLEWLHRSDAQVSMWAAVQVVGS